MLNRLTFLLGLLIAVTLCPLMAGYAEAAPPNKFSMSRQPEIRVGIWSNQSSIVVSSDVAFVLADSRTNKKLGEFSAKDKVSVTGKKGQIVINGKQTTANGLHLVMSDKSGEHYFEVNRKRYRGAVSIHRTAGKEGLTVVNTLPLEQYLYGIVPEEMPGEWPMEAVKAQAVAARTFALNHLNKHSSDGYDVCATTHCQVYGGKNSETVRTTKAVDDTFGQVLLYQGKPIEAMFHSSAGGTFTEDSENVWGGSYAYLRSVSDYDRQSPYLHWNKQITPQEMDQSLSRAGYSIGRVIAIELSPLGQAPAKAKDRGVSGRVKSIGFIGEKGRVELSGNQVRSMLALSSTLFEVKAVVPTVKGIDVKITDRYGDRETKIIDVNVPPQEEKGLLTDKENIIRIAGRKNEVWEFSGSGSGHGVGLSQWGAKSMAEQAPQEDATYFKEILKHYYQSTVVKKVY